jgi:hypothetical protein
MGGSPRSRVRATGRSPSGPRQPAADAWPRRAPPSDGEAARRFARTFPVSPPAWDPFPPLPPDGGWHRARRGTPSPSQHAVPPRIRPKRRRGLTGSQGGLTPRPRAVDPAGWLRTDAQAWCGRAEPCAPAAGEKARAGAVEVGPATGAMAVLPSWRYGRRSTDRHPVRDSQPIDLSRRPPCLRYRCAPPHAGARRPPGRGSPRLDSDPVVTA